MIDSTLPASQITSMLSDPGPTSQKEIMGRDDFLLILITQLRHQDPMEPMGQEEMIAQLTQFNILDEVRDLNGAIVQGMEQNQQNIAVLIALQQAMLNSQSVSLIGKQISANHDGLQVGEGDPPTYLFEAPAGTANVTVTILDSSGVAARVEDLGAQSGTLEYRPNTGSLSEGTYSIQAEAVMNDGTTLPLVPRLRGTVNGLHFVEGMAVLDVDGQEIFLSDVISVVG